MTKQEAINWIVDSLGTGIPSVLPKGWYEKSIDMFIKLGMSRGHIDDKQITKEQS